MNLRIFCDRDSTLAYPEFKSRVLPLEQPGHLNIIFIGILADCSTSKIYSIWEQNSLDLRYICTDPPPTTLPLLPVKSRTTSTGVQPRANINGTQIKGAVFTQTAKAKTNVPFTPLTPLPMKARQVQIPFNSKQERAVTHCSNKGNSPFQCTIFFSVLYCNLCAEFKGNIATKFIILWCTFFLVF